ncbi:YolD-like family protein [Bacillus sp. FJAT-29937]|uniref:YolD-like family protein n=1 Tax=Bacillus sp. FJAT-29937 TaxID=1720553 RepID=UPI00082F5936|nr:YolD-like family protein [Bacillus sp. FJAT-29937]
MLKDRGIIKWNAALMLPEHVHSLKAALIDEQIMEKPELDEQAIQQFEMTICESMEFNNSLVLEIFDNGFVKTIKGTVTYINHLKSQLIIKDPDDIFHHIPFKNLINIQQL